MGIGEQVIPTYPLCLVIGAPIANYLVMIDSTTSIFHSIHKWYISGKMTVYQRKNLICGRAAGDVSTAGICGISMAIPGEAQAS